ncbi:PREDICTED: uncharacterized protein LOC107083275 isoform X3 [Cyprinodon variegatus]|uniref:uncharacterized protein LOC107083275 isoform X3 n=1 Tax=Cyprinodon variegatus TaxID=28743 RepID=UPI00074256F0|nr:PREDICTED: uncharacterized protein LOC107083275 isoform X3 [Cyprinodon variegatus]
MDPDVLGKSQLLDSLKAYLNNKTRLQPIIGLGTIIECVNVSSQLRQTLYLCEVCDCRLTKADMRNHIMGSHHRFNYIKTHHPYMVSKWLESPDLSKMAWPLMELAKVLEKKEGPGLVQLFEVKDDHYQMMATQSENHAVTLAKALRKQQELESFSKTAPLHYPVVSQRTVLPARNQPKDPESRDRTCFKNISPPQLEEVQMLGDASVEPERATDFLDDGAETKPLIGLARVVEFRSEDGCSYCFLCHCCRIRSTKQDITDHLTSSSHLVNYLMEIYPDYMEALGEVTEDNFQLQSLAAKVEEEEGRGEMKIVNVPESICSQLTGKSYHWCLKMLSSGGKYSNLRQKREAVRGVNQITAPPAGKKIPVISKRREKRKKKQMKNNQGKKTDTMFNVSLPVGKGELLLERRSFSKFRRFESPESLPSKLDPVKSPSGMVETSSLADDPVDPTNADPELPSSRVERHLYTEDAGTMEHNTDTQIKVTVFQDGDGYFEEHQSEHNKPVGPQECLSADWNPEAPQAQSGELFSSIPHHYNSNYMNGNCSSDFWYSSASAGENEEASRQGRGRMDVNSSSVQQQPQYQQPSWSNTLPYTKGIWEHQVVSYLNTVRINTQSDSGHIPVCGGGFSEGSRGHEYETQQRYSELSADHYQPVPHSYTTPPSAFEVSPMQQRLMFHTNSGALPSTQPYLSYPVTHGRGWGWTQADAVIQPDQTGFYNASSDVYFRAGV